MKLATALEGVRRIFLDTAPAIYYFERHPTYFTPMEAFFRLRREMKIEIVTSPVTLAECLIHPMRRGLKDIAQGYKGLILHGEDTDFQEIAWEAAERAAAIRSFTAIPLVDALQPGVAAVAKCDAFLTNDRRLSTISDMRVLVIDDVEI